MENMDKVKPKSVEAKAIEGMRKEIDAAGLTLTDAQLEVIIKLVKKAKG